jgi:hypothetical protein
MSEIKVDTLTGKTTAKTVTVTVGATATMSLEQGLAKAWFQFAGRGTAVLNDGLNITSLSDVGTGNYDLSYTNNMANTTYAFSNGQGWDVGVTSSTTSGTDKDLIFTSGIRVLHVNMADGAYDPDLSMGSFDGDLA